MSIYIKGMEMPKPGAYICELGVLDANTAVLTIYTHIDEQQKSYNLVPVPPHGSLKDADKLIQFAKDKARQIADEEANPPRSIAVSGLSIEDVMNAPAIIEAEEG